MTNDTLKLTDKEVLDYARTGLQEHLPLEAEGYQCSTADLLDALLGIAVGRDTLEAVCADWLDMPDADTIRGYLNKQLTVEGLSELERRLNSALAAEIPQRVWQQARDVAIDLHDRPYYGKAPQEEGLWVRGKAKNGTTRFYRVATAYVMQNGLRVTLLLPARRYRRHRAGRPAAPRENRGYQYESPVPGQGLRWHCGPGASDPTRATCIDRLPYPWQDRRHACSVPGKQELSNIVYVQERHDIFHG